LSSPIKRVKGWCERTARRRRKTSNEPLESLMPANRPLESRTREVSLAISLLNSGMLYRKTGRPSGVPDARYHRHGAVFHRHLHHPAAVLRREMHELAGGAADTDGSHTSRGGEVDQSFQPVEIRPAARPVRRYQGGVDALQHGEVISIPGGSSYNGVLWFGCF
jgi:hypothetical protein